MSIAPNPLSKTNKSKTPTLALGQVGQNTTTTITTTTTTTTTGLVSPRREKASNALPQGGAATPSQTSDPDLSASKRSEKGESRGRREKTEKGADSEQKKLRRHSAEFRAPVSFTSTGSTPPSTQTAALGSPPVRLPPPTPTRSPVSPAMGENTADLASSRACASTVLGTLRPQAVPQKLSSFGDSKPSGDHLLQKNARTRGPQRSKPTKTPLHLATNAISPLTSPRKDEAPVSPRSASESAEPNRPALPPQEMALDVKKPVGGRAMPGLGSTGTLRKTGSAFLKVPAELLAKESEESQQAANQAQKPASSEQPVTKASVATIKKREEFTRGASVAYLKKAAVKSRATTIATESGKPQEVIEYNGKHLRKLITTTCATPLQKFGIQQTLLKLASAATIPDSFALDDPEFANILSEAVEKLGEDERASLKSRADKVTMLEDPFGQGENGFHLQLFINCVVETCEAMSVESSTVNTADTSNSSAKTSASSGEKKEALQLFKFISTLLGLYGDTFKELKVYEQLAGFAAALRKYSLPTDSENEAINKALNRLTRRQRDELIDVMGVVVENGTFNDSTVFLRFLLNLAVLSSESLIKSYQRINLILNV